MHAAIKVLSFARLHEDQQAPCLQVVQWFFHSDQFCWVFSSQILSLAFSPIATMADGNSGMSALRHHRRNSARSLNHFLIRAIRFSPNSLLLGFSPSVWPNPVSHACGPSSCPPLAALASPVFSWCPRGVSPAVLRPVSWCPPRDSRGRAVGLLHLVQALSSVWPFFSTR